MKAVKQFVRNFRKQRVVGTLNVASLALGVMVSVMIGMWVWNESSFDNFHTDGDRIYRAITRMSMNGVESSGAPSWKFQGEETRAHHPEVEDVVRTIPNLNDNDLVVDGTPWSGVDFLVTTGGFFEFFNFPLLAGDPHTVIDSPGKAVVSERAAVKYFGDPRPLGRTMTIDGHTFTVEGVMQDTPVNSHIQPELVLPFGSGFYDWEGDMFTTYFKLAKGAEPSRIEDGIEAITYERMPMYKNLGAEFGLEPLHDIHFSTNGIYDKAIKGNRRMVGIFALVAAVILIISCINFVNLFISTSLLRARTIGIKKVMGADRRSLVMEFYGETAVYVVLSLALGIVAAHLAMPVFSSLVHTNLAIDFTSWRLWALVGALVVVMVVLAGSFPALYMTSSGIVETLQGKFKGWRVAWLQKGFLVLQFAASTFLVIVVFVFGRQVSHMLSVDLGFDMENVVYTAAKPGFGLDNYTALREEMMREPSIMDVTRRTGIPTEWAGGMPLKEGGSDGEVIVERIGVAANYFDFMGIKLIGGENPFRDDAPNAHDVVINPMTALALGLDDPVGKEIRSEWFEPFVVRGEIGNVRTRSLHKEIESQVYVAMEHGNGTTYLYFKIKGDPAAALAAIERRWKSTATESQSFRYDFLDQTHAQLYRAETDSRNVLAWALAITLLITVAGLFATAYFSMQRRVREVGIRRINGARVRDVLVLLNREMVMWVGLAFVLGAAVSWLFLHDWLGGFVVRTPLSVWIFLAAGALMCLVALATVSYQTWTVATTNPVKALKSD